MSQAIENFSRFYSLLKELPYDGDKEELKELLVSQCSNGRTVSLRELTRTEYVSVCELMEKQCPRSVVSYDALRRKRRSTCLLLLQKIGVDTTDWTAVNAYCSSSKIAGKEFRYLSIDELTDLSKKLRMILQKKS